ncbi:MAG TPA: (2Fe-2S) ferredoxin domain-containing protein [Stenomitos sp.]
MQPSHDGQRFAFDIEGHFLGFEREGYKVKYLHIGLANEQFRVKVPKHLRLGLQAGLALDAPIRVGGHGKFDPLKGQMKLKAQQVQIQPQEVPECSAQAIATAPCCPLAAVAAPRLKILLCHKSGCQKRGGRQVSRTLEATLRDRNLANQVTVQYTGCQKRCSSAPSLMVLPGKHLYKKVAPQQVPSLIDKHFGEQ